MAADNTVLNPGVGGVTVRTYSDGTLEHPAGVLEFISGGSAGAWTFTAVDSTHGLPVAVVGSVAVTGTFFQATQPVSGTVTVNAGSGTFTISGAVTNAGTFAVQATLSAETTKVIGTVNVAASQTIGLAAGSAVIGHVIVDSGTLAATQSGTWNIGTVTTVTGVTTVSTVTSLSQWAGNAIDTNSGSKSAGTLRVVLATDQPQLTNKLLVTPDANSAVNVSQINGVTVLMGNGVTGTGSQRVTIASDQTAYSVNAIQSGTWNVGTVTTVSTVTNLSQMGGVAIALNKGTSDTGTQRVTLGDGAQVIGQVSASPETSTVYSGTTALTPKFAKISCAASGDNTLVAGVSSKKIRVLSISLMIVGAAISIYFRDNTAGTAIFADGTNPIPLDKTGAAGAGGFVLGFNPVGWMQSSTSNPLVLNLSGAQAVAGGLVYVEA